MGWGHRIAAAALAAITACAGVAFWGALRVMAPGPLAEQATVVIARGSGLESIAATLDKAGVIDEPLLFLYGTKLTDDGRALRAGEYAFAPGISIQGVLEQMRLGKTVVHRFTVPEGLTSAQVVALLGAETALTGTVDDLPPNGSLLPETYHFSFGDARPAIVARMRQSMDKALAELWKARDEDLPFKTVEEAVTLASIVEKETGVASERTRVAGVFLNRLKVGMRLQSDPTVIFALTDGKGELGRVLTRADWRYESPYNTYVVEGLPPGPIANPGLASLSAVLRPERHEFLYFVADGTGGHAFAKTLAEHNKNVARWRAVQQRSPGSGETSSE